MYCQCIPCMDCMYYIWRILSSSASSRPILSWYISTLQRPFWLRLPSIPGLPPKLFPQPGFGENSLQPEKIFTWWCWQLWFRCYVCKRRRAFSWLCWSLHFGSNLSGTMSLRSLPYFEQRYENGMHILLHQLWSSENLLHVKPAALKKRTFDLTPGRSAAPHPVAIEPRRPMSLERQGA